jgi:hypothetical protein
MKLKSLINTTKNFPGGANFLVISETFLPIFKTTSGHTDLDAAASRHVLPLGFLHDDAPILAVWKSNSLNIILPSGILRSGILRLDILRSGILRSGILRSGILSSVLLPSGILPSGILSTIILFICIAYIQTLDFRPIHF